MVEWLYKFSILSGKQWFTIKLLRKYELLILARYFSFGQFGKVLYKLK
jgi:hypothetical protein